MGFWLQLGVSGFRMDAVPFLLQKKCAGIEWDQDFTLLNEMREFLQWRSGNAILLAEANVPPDESMQYFGAEGERLQMMLNFAVNQRLFYALATGDIGPLIWRSSRRKSVPEPLNGFISCAATTSSICAVWSRSSARRWSPRSVRARRCSSTTGGSDGASHRCSMGIGAGSSWRSVCCSHCPAPR